MMFGSVPTKFRFGSCGSFSFAGSMTSRFVPVRVCRFVSVRGHTATTIPVVSGEVLHIMERYGEGMKSGLELVGRNVLLWVSSMVPAQKDNRARMPSQPGSR